MWQSVIVALLVVVAAVYAVRTLGPRRWRRKSGAGGGCGCGKGEGGCR